MICTATEFHSDRKLCDQPPSNYICMYTIFSTNFIRFICFIWNRDNCAPVNDRRWISYQRRTHFQKAKRPGSPRIRRISNVIEFYTYILNAALGSSVYLGKWSWYGFWNEMLSKAYSYFTFRAARRKKTGNPLFLRVLCIRDIKRRFMVRYSPRWFGIEEFSCFRLQKTRRYIVVKYRTKFENHVVCNKYKVSELAGGNYEH